LPRKRRREGAAKRRRKRRGGKVDLSMVEREAIVERTVFLFMFDYLFYSKYYFKYIKI
jgi:hypothetical protein